ncbi:DNA-binding PadR family transcriptional regulator [Bradyrhizobium sp. GM2.2]|nr:DNA-binding PadR family transcriptional regulator [Bradyrhizobium canariense]
MLNPRKRRLFLLAEPFTELGVGVTERLEKQGHKVYALTLTGLAERSHLLSRDINLDTHITDIANLVEWEDLTDICLVAGLP